MRASSLLKALTLSLLLLAVPSHAIIKSMGGSGSGGEAGPQPYDIALQFEGVPDESVVMLRYIFPRAADFADDFAGSKGVAVVAATAETVFLVKKNGTNVGTVTFAAAGTVPTYATGDGAISFAEDDILTFVSPATPDATLADMAFTLAGTR